MRELSEICGALADETRLVNVALRLRRRHFPAETAEVAGVKSCCGSVPAEP